ncbi:histidine phosphatase family protein [Brevibacillus migulae]|uniref:histidine phosphatase family protein n=1 Tax=Brevibacillus migulae TaxID=1644114 RepID=UPI00106E4A62|nr:histidine phosphatase family protein [Brevibacillus migulae]
MKWIWVRHGETEENRMRRYLGQADPPLNSTGVAQARYLAQRLSEWPITAVYTSDLQRCIQTATAISERHGLQPIACPALRELSFGRWEGKTYAEIMEEDREHAVKWYSDPFAVAPPAGETLKAFGDRIDRSLQGILATCAPHDTVLLVSHGGVIRWFQSKWIHGDPRRFWEVQAISHGDALVAHWDGSHWFIESTQL